MANDSREADDNARRTRNGASEASDRNTYEGFDGVNYEQIRRPYIAQTKERHIKRIEEKDNNAPDRD